MPALAASLNYSIIDLSLQAWGPSQWGSQCLRADRGTSCWGPRAKCCCCMLMSSMSLFLDDHEKQKLTNDDKNNQEMFEAPAEPTDLDVSKGELQSGTSSNSIVLVFNGCNKSWYGNKVSDMQTVDCHYVDIFVLVYMSFSAWQNSPQHKAHNRCLPSIRWSTSPSAGTKWNSHRKERKSVNKRLSTDTQKTISMLSLKPLLC